MTSVYQCAVSCIKPTSEIIFHPHWYLFNHESLDSDPVMHYATSVLWVQQLQDREEGVKWHLDAGERCDSWQIIIVYKNAAQWGYRYFIHETAFNPRRTCSYESALILFVTVSGESSLQCSSYTGIWNTHRNMEVLHLRSSSTKGKGGLPAR